MKKEEILIENIKCSGCSNSIIKALQSMDKVEEVIVDIENQQVQVTADSSLDRALLISELARLGYPEQGHNTVMHKAKSFVSCATGKFQNT